MHEIGLLPTVSDLVANVDRLRGDSWALVAFDAPIGLPSSYLSAARTALHLPGATDFLGWLRAVNENRGVFEAVVESPEWSVERPFFVLQHGNDGYRQFIRAAGAFGIDRRREIVGRLHAAPPPGEGLREGTRGY
jgi:hypothetical protein